MVLVTVTHMPDEADSGGGTSKAVAATADSVEAYETDDGVVLYDAGNPLAWIESRSPVRLDDAV
jgi:hypothetical protein